MERAFHLTNEFRRNGPEQLTALLAASSQTVAWGPVFPLLRDAYIEGRSLLSPKGFIQLLEQTDGPLKVMARAEWLTDPGFRRKYKWEPARVWRAEFDGEIRRIALEDISKPPVDQRVIIAKPERGWGRAEERLAKADRGKVLRLLRALYSTGQLPPGIRQRAAENESTNKRHPAETILRDIFNHEDAINDSRSSITGLDPRYTSFVDSLASVGIQLDVPVKSPGGLEDRSVNLEHVAEVLSRITPITNEHRFLRFLKSPDRRAFRQLIYLPQNVWLRPELHRRLITAAKPQPLLRALFPGVATGDPISATLTGWELASLVCSFLTLPLRPWHLVPLATRLTQASLQRLGVLPLKIRPEDHDLRCLFYMCYGTRRPTLKQVRALIDALKEDLQEQNPP